MKTKNQIIDPRNSKGKYNKGWKEAKEMKPYKPGLDDVLMFLDKVIEERKAINNELIYEYTK